MKKKFTKIFLVTDQQDYLDLFKKKYNNILCYRNSFRSNKSRIFHLTARKNHRYEMGRDALEEMILFSKLKYLVCSTSNLSQASVMISKNATNVFEICNKMNSKRIIVSQFLWYIKKNLPHFLGGFDNKVT